MPRSGCSALHEVNPNIKNSNGVKKFTRPSTNSKRPLIRQNGGKIFLEFLKVDLENYVRTYCFTCYAFDFDFKYLRHFIFYLLLPLQRIKISFFPFSFHLRLKSLFLIHSTLQKLSFGDVM